MAGRTGGLAALLPRARSLPPIQALLRLRSLPGLQALLRPEGARRRLTGWGLALDTVIAAAAAAAAVTETNKVQTVGPFAVKIAGHPVVVFPPHVVSLAPPGLVLAGATLTGLPLVARRVYPVVSWLVIVVTIMTIRHWGVPPVAFGSAVLATYSAVAYSRYRYLASGSALLVAVAVTATFGKLLPRFPGRVTVLVAMIPVVAAGLGIRELRRRLADSADRLRRASEEQEAATRRAVARERARIAGELHDVVTHNVSVMVVQAGAARKVLVGPATVDPATAERNVRLAEQALLAVEASGRTAMGELRHLLGLLSPVPPGPWAGSGDVPVPDSGSGHGPDGADGVALRPQPGLGQLEPLLERVRAAGLAVQLQVTGTPRPVAPGPDLAGYRVVQEALTNVIKHAGAAPATVAVCYQDETLEITVSDEGTVPEGSGSRVHPGRGLLGLRERLAVYGGKLDAGPRPDGGWGVHAVIPLERTGVAA